MGKVLANGHAEQDFAPDHCRIALLVEMEAPTAAKATAAAVTEFEKLLACLAEIGIQPENMVITEDRSEKPYSRSKDGYSSKKTVLIYSKVNVPLVNRIHNIIASGFENTTMAVSYELASRANIMRELTKQAILDSRRTAELLADTTGMEITGIEAAKLSDDYDMDMDIADLDLAIISDEANIHRCEVSERARGLDTSFSDQLTPEKITLKADVRIVWQVEAKHQA